MAIDSIVSAAALFSASVAAWMLTRPLKFSARLYLRFAAVLFSALGASCLFGLADVAVLLLLPLASVSLALSCVARFTRSAGNFLASLSLMVALGGGLGAMFFGPMILGLGPAMLASFVIICMASMALAPLGALSGIALLVSTLSDLGQGAKIGTVMLCAAALIGLAKPSKFAVEQMSRSLR